MAKPKIQLSPLAKETVEKAFQNMRQFPDAFDMQTYIEKRKTSCGTAACLAGEIGLVAGFKDDTQTVSRLPMEYRKFLRKNGFLSQSRVGVGHFAMLLLGLTSVQRWRLFHAAEWAQPFRSEYYELVGMPGVRSKAWHRKMTALAIRRFKHFINTGN